MLDVEIPGMAAVRHLGGCSWVRTHGRERVEQERAFFEGGLRELVCEALKIAQCVDFPPLP
jgi:hypothetical protein